MMVAMMMTTMIDGRYIGSSTTRFTYTSGRRLIILLHFPMTNFVVVAVGGGGDSGDSGDSGGGVVVLLVIATNDQIRKDRGHFYFFWSHLLFL